MKSALFLVTALALVGCDGMPAPRKANLFNLPPADFIADANRGSVLYRQSCSTCHGGAARGSDRGPPLVHSTYDPTHHADLAFHLAVNNGVRRHHWRFGDMPPIPGLTPEAIGHIIAYVRATQRRAGIE